MDRTKLSEDRYIAELNRQLREHTDYEDGMEFLPNPPGSSGSGVMGVMAAGHDQNHRAYVQTRNKVMREFDMVATPRN